MCLLWASGSVILQFVADDIGYNRPFIFTYIGSGVITGLVPSYLGLALLGLVQNPPLREGSGKSRTTSLCILGYMSGTANARTLGPAV